MMMDRPYLCHMQLDLAISNQFKHLAQLCATGLHKGHAGRGAVTLVMLLLQALNLSLVCIIVHDVREVAVRLEDLGQLAHLTCKPQQQDQQDNQANQVDRTINTVIVMTNSAKTLVRAM